MIKEIIKKSPQIKFLGIAWLLILVMLVFSHAFGAGVKGADTSDVVMESKPFPQVELTAQAVYVYDVRSGTALFEKEPDRRMPLASLTKVMAALTALEIAPSNSRVVVTGDALANEGDSGLYKDEEWSLKELLDYSLVTSSNDGMRAVALALGAVRESDPDSARRVSDFVGLMNEKARELGLFNSYYWNETGLDESDRKGGAYGSARDTAKLFAYIVKNHPGILEATRSSADSFTSLSGHTHAAKNTNSTVDEIVGIVASKTGYTDIAGGNLAIAFDPELGRPVVVVVLGSTEKERFRDVEKLVAATIEYLTTN